MDIIDDIASPNYKISVLDYLNCRTKTTGIVEVNVSKGTNKYS